MDSYEKYAMSKCGWLLETDMFKNIPEKDRMEVLVHFAVAVGQDWVEYDDNYRIFPMTKEGKRQYTEIQNKGCCGFYDTSVKVSSGRVYLIGFNYGH